MSSSTTDLAHETTGGLDVSTLRTPRALGVAAGTLAAELLRDALRTRPRVRLMLAAAPSQLATLEVLRNAEDIDWGLVDAFHMDDYLGLPTDAPQGFANWLQIHFVDRLPGLAFHRMRTTGDPERAAVEYEELLGTAPFDLVLLGLGVNGHLAFNDPPADLRTTRAVHVVGLDEVCRRQQVEEGHFADVESVPPRALSVTIPRLLNADRIVASVPGRQKRQAVLDMLTAPVSGDHPGTALRTHPRTSVFLDEDSDPR